MFGFKCQEGGTVHLRLDICPSLIVNTYPGGAVKRHLEIQLFDHSVGTCYAGMMSSVVEVTPRVFISST